MGEVDTSFINPINSRPKLINVEDDNIPTIDISSISSINHIPATNTAITDPKLLVLVSEIREACEKWGFFKVVNHGIPVDTIVKLERATNEFFGLSKDEKRKVSRSEGMPMGYYDDELSEGIKDWKECFAFAVYDDDSNLPLLTRNDGKGFQFSNRFPDYPPQFGDIIHEYATLVKNLGIKLLAVIALGLQVRTNRLTDFFKETTSFVRLHRYMKCPRPDLVVGVGAHKDIGAINLIFEDDVGGLQIRRKSDGEWISNKPIPNAFVINVGEMLQVWSNNKYDSVEHRVLVNQEKERFSIAFSLGPAYDTIAKPLEELVDGHNNAKYKEQSYGALHSLLFASNDIKGNYIEVEDK